jgi:hypothetical protein
VRLHPAKDGLLPHPDERGMTRRDRGGNPLRDVTDHETGFCTGVTSPLLSSGLSVIPHVSPSGGVGPDTRFSAERQVYYDMVRSSETAPIGLVVRTTTDCDGPLPITRVRVVESSIPVTGDSVANCTAPVLKSVSVRKANDAAVKAVLSAMGYKGPITREIRKATLEMIALERSITGQ